MISEKMRGLKEQEAEIADVKGRGSIGCVALGVFLVADVGV